MRSSAATFFPPTVRSLVATACLAAAGCASGPPAGIEPVGNFDAERYLGTWYEIARLDHRFERGLEAVSASYARNDDGTIAVVNRGWNVEEGKWQVAEGEARFADGPDTGWLEVSFFGPFYGTYAVFELLENEGGEYERAYVAGDDRDYLWFLSRTPEVEPAALDAFRERAAALGFDVGELIVVDQGAAALPPPE